MTDNCGIYKYENPSGQIYIGQTRNFKQRLKHYRATPNSSMPKKIEFSLREHGFQRNHFELILPCDLSVSKSELNYAECYLIRYHESDSSRNLNIRGGGLNGKHAESTKLKLRNCNLGKRHPNFVNAQKGKPLSEKQKLLIRSKMIGSDNHFSGKSHSKEKLIQIGIKVAERFKQRKDDGIKAKIYDKVYKIDINTGLILDTYNSVIAAAKSNSIGKNHIHNVLSKKQFTYANGVNYIKETAGGFKWEGVLR